LTNVKQLLSGDVCSFDSHLRSFFGSCC
jgi:hypothetical protein